MQYIVKMMNGNSHKLTEEQLKNLILGDGLCVLKTGEGLTKSRVEDFYPETKQTEIESKKDMQTGRLHDGTRVKRHFGQWVTENMAVDDRGNYVPVRIDPHYYPEVAQDKVFSEVEFEKIKHLPTAERLQLVSGGEKKQIVGSSGLEKIDFKN